MMEKLTENRQALHLLVITVLTLGVYLNALQAGFLAVDDVDTIRHVQSGSVTIHGLFFRSAGGDYYRPLTILSYLADFYLFSGNPAGYHLTNILLHLANALLVYYLATLLLGKDKQTGSYSLFAALIFALHPINTEAVVWISARTDILCCLFLLLCLVLLVKKSFHMTPVVFMGLLLTFLFSLAAKESSLFLPFLAIVYFLQERKTVPTKSALAMCGAIGIATLFYLLLRKGFPITSTSTTATTMHTGITPFSFLIDGAATLGFYLRKLIYPFPLSIAIIKIPSKLCIGFFLLGSGIAAFMWKKKPSLRFPVSFLAFSLVPPLGAFYLSPAWTPYAERYMYIPSVAFALYIAIFFRNFFGSFPRYGPVVCIILLAIPTAYRVAQWTKPIDFWQDAVAKSPGFGTIRLTLAATYIEAGRYAEASNSLDKAEQLGLPRKSARNFSHELQEILNEKGKCSIPTKIPYRNRTLRKNK